MDTSKIYDIIGIGIGPFNLGLAALCEKIESVNTLFIDKNNSFNWHPGLMLPTAKMQVPFYADLVTLADPTSKFSYMNYLKQTGKLFRFAINESYFPYRREYNAYCQWVVGQLNNVQFGCTCENIYYDDQEKVYRLLTQVGNETEIFTAKHIVIGVSSTPHLPDCAKNIDHPNVFHASEYLQHKDAAIMKGNITIIGSGQSAAEIFQDLLPHLNNLKSLHWYTRSDRFYAMDYSKFALELSTPEYINYFFDLPAHKNPQILKNQHDLYKGINFSLIDEIYQQLYLLSLDKKNTLPQLFTNCALKKVSPTTDNHFELVFDQLQTEKSMTHTTESVILATGYRPTTPDFLSGIKEYINWNQEGKYAIDRNYCVDNNHSIFMQNAEWHTHGFNSADLGLGPFRNTRIINTIMNEACYAENEWKPFQNFGKK